MQHIIVIGGGKHQFPGIVKIKDMGHHVVVFDKNLYPPTQNITDEIIQIDIINHEEIINHLRNHSYIVHHCMSFATEAALATVVAINEAFGLRRGLRREELNFSSNKFLQREIQKDALLPCPKYFTSADPDDAFLQIKTHGISFPLIIKPLDGAGSRGVHFIQSKQELTQYFPHTLAVSRKNEILVEEFINGIEFTMEALIHDDDISIVAISEKKKPLNNFSVSTELFYNSPLVNRLRTDIEYHVMHYLKSAELQNTVIHMELIYSFKDNKIYILETSTRSGGFGVFDTIIPLASGLDFVSLFIRLSMGDAIALPAIKFNPVILRFFTANTGVFDGYFIVDESLKVNNTIVHLFDINIGKDYSVDDDGTRSMLGYIVSYGETYETVFGQANLVENNYRFLIGISSKEKQ